MQFVKIVVIDKNSPSFDVYSGDVCIDSNTVWHIYKKTGVVSTEDFKTMAKLVVGAPSCADVSAFIKAEYVIDPETGEVHELGVMSDSDFYQMVYDHRKKLVVEKHEECKREAEKKRIEAEGIEAYQYLFSLLDFLQGV